ncbi:hypothetical protein BDN72DRAFT_903994 [Pluteus cervinus]|uniref:Uncharacterized protein n=1 Tax=Pluteus cervinus TaxID=181527 RepID=A0ACD3A7B3_9AGAR|nr:hypothetical protein BDN72DRAFT_903994 [Pluteus cervinus]
MTLVDYTSSRSSSPVSGQFHPSGQKDSFIVELLPDYNTSPSASASRNWMRQKRPRSSSIRSLDGPTSDNEPDPKRSRVAESNGEDSDGEVSNPEQEQKDVEAAVLGDDVEEESDSASRDGFVPKAKNATSTAKKAKAGVKDDVQPTFAAKKANTNAKDTCTPKNAKADVAKAKKAPFTTTKAKADVTSTAKKANTNVKDTTSAPKKPRADLTAKKAKADVKDDARSTSASKKTNASTSKKANASTSKKANANVKKTRILWKGDDEARRVADELHSAYMKSKKILSCAYETLSEERKKQFEDAARIAMHLFLQAEDPEESFPLPANICKASRDSVSFLPEIACTSKELSLHLLTTSNSRRCLSHWWRSRSSAKLKDARVDAYTKDVPVLDCGCSVDVALWEFYVYKRWMVGLHNPRPLMVSYECRDRLMQAMSEVLGIRGPEELFNSRGTGWRDPEHQVEFKKDMIAAWQEQVRHLEGDVEMENEVEEQIRHSEDEVEEAEVDNEVQEQPNVDLIASTRASSSKVTLEALGEDISAGTKRRTSRWDS